MDPIKQYQPNESNTETEERLEDNPQTNNPLQDAYELEPTPDVIIDPNKERAEPTEGWRRVNGEEADNKRTPEPDPRFGGPTGGAETEEENSTRPTDPRDDVFSQPAEDWCEQIAAEAEKEENQDLEIPSRPADAQLPAQGHSSERE